MELMIHSEVFNGVWDALIDGRVEVAIGATRAVPAGGRYAFRDMGFCTGAVWSAPTTRWLRSTAS